MDIAVIGSNMVDLITYVERMPDVGETLAAPDFRMGHGGKGANQAIAASRLGADVLMLTRVGNDSFADDTVANFEANGIDTARVLRTEATSGVAPIFVDPQGNNSILIIKGANDQLSPADIDAVADEIAACRLIVLQLEVPLETVYHAVAFGEAHGVPVLLNPAPATAELDFERVASVDWFVPNETELALLSGRAVESMADVDAAAETLLKRGMRNVLVTVGARGAVWYHGDQRHLVEGEEVTTVDSTGAGDAFIGCFAHGLVTGLAVEDALARANAYAADSVTRRGTQTSYATAEEFGG
ncbi:ribokinase [Nigerium massiliense]|uniref:ribokinase n=1 Tax=Nigerium massiliense TaxID=1522317 RepID=UPI00058DA881|nr:ribokinase [Nigerium massiliense]